MDRSLSRACRTTEVRSTDNVSPHENARPIILNERDIINELNNIVTIVPSTIFMELSQCDATIDIKMESPQTG